MANIKRSGMATRRIIVDVRQTASARSGQGGNPIAINASDVGVVRTEINTKTNTNAGSKN